MCKSNGKPGRLFSKSSGHIQGEQLDARQRSQAARQGLHGKYITRPSSHRAPYCTHYEHGGGRHHTYHVVAALGRLTVYYLCVYM